MAKVNLFKVVSTLYIIESNRLWSMWTCQPSNSRLKRWNHTEVGILFLLAWYKLCVCISINSWIFYFKILYICRSRHGQQYIDYYERDCSNGIRTGNKDIELIFCICIFRYNWFYCTIIYGWFSFPILYFPNVTSQSSLVWVQQNIYAFLIT